MSERHNPHNRRCIGGDFCVCPPIPPWHDSSPAKRALDMLNDSLERGETSLGIAVDIYELIHKHEPTLAKMFTAAYADLCNDDIDELPDELLEQVRKELTNLALK